MKPNRTYEKVALIHGVSATIAADVSKDTTLTTTNTKLDTINTSLSTVNTSVSDVEAAVTAIGADIVVADNVNSTTLNSSLGTINTSIGTGNSSLSTIATQTNATNLSNKLDTINTSVGTGNSSLSTIATQTNSTNLSDKLTTINTSIGTGNTSLSTIATKTTSMDIDISKISSDMTEVTAQLLNHVKAQQEVLLYAGTTDYYTGTNVDSNFLGYVQNTRGIDVYVTEYRLQIICLTVAVSLSYDRFWDSTTAGGAFTIGQGSSTAAGTFGNSYVFNNSNIFAFLESTYTAATETYYNFVFPCRIHVPDQNYIKWKINGKMPVTSKYSVVAKYDFLD